MRKTPLVTGEFYHIFNRGVDKRKIFQNVQDLERFFVCMKVFNTVQPVGSLYEHSFQDDVEQKPLVRFVAYCLLPNHFHFILEQVVDGGISEFMKRIQGGYTWYFNNRNKRSGALFQGRFKSIHIDSNEYLKYVSAYVNLNDRQKDQLGGWTAKLVKSSWGEYIQSNKKSNDFCEGKGIVLNQFSKVSDYENFALEVLKEVKVNKEKYKELED